MWGVSEWKVCDGGHSQTLCVLGEDGSDVAPPRAHSGEPAEGQSGDAVQDARPQYLEQHAVHTVGRFADILQEQNTAPGGDGAARTAQRRQDREVPADQLSHCASADERAGSGIPRRGSQQSGCAARKERFPE